MRSLSTLIRASGLAASLAVTALPGTAHSQGFFDRFLRPTPPAAVVVPSQRVGPTWAYGNSLREPHILNRHDNLPVGRRSIVVFVGRSCNQCYEAIEDAKAMSGVPVEVMDISAGGIALEAFNLIGPGGLPATVAGSQILVGRDPNLLRQVAGGAGMNAN